jgi:N-formylglutamate amidohydrolase
MPSVWPAGGPGAGERVASDFILGDRDGTTCAPSFTAFVRETLAGLGYEVAVNDRFKGVEIVRANGRPAENRHSLQIEITRSLYMDEKTLEKTPGYAALKADLDRLVAAVCDFAREQARRPPPRLRPAR